MNGTVSRWIRFVMRTQCVTEFDVWRMGRHGIWFGRYLRVRRLGLVCQLLSITGFSRPSFPFDCRTQIT